LKTRPNQGYKADPTSIDTELIESGLEMKGGPLDFDNNDDFDDTDDPGAKDGVLLCLDDEAGNGYNSNTSILSCKVELEGKGSGPSLSGLTNAALTQIGIPAGSPRAPEYEHRTSFS
jgi:hypothetical protein